MHNPSIKHTLNVFSHLIKKLPPLVDKNIKADCRRAYEQISQNYDLGLAEFEKTIIIFGKKLWPYRRAFEEFFNLYESKFGEKFLIGKLAPALKKRYKEFREYGGAFRDLHSGNPALFFSPVERVEICRSLMSVNDDIIQYTAQAVLTSDRVAYEKRIVEFQVILDDIEKRLDSLRLMADDEQEHPELAAEIRQQVLSFEYGLCLLGPPHHYAAICQAEDHFVGRRKEKSLRAGVV